MCLPYYRSKLLLTVAALLCGLVRSIATPSILDTAVNPGNGHTYYLLSSSTWTDAESEAVSLGGHLATIRNQTEDDWLSGLWGVNRNLWIGLYDPNFTTDGSGAQHAADFIWSDGESAGYRNWYPGEPNGNPGEGYTYMYAQSIGFGDVWNDLANVSSTPGEPNLFGVVEVVPEPSAFILLAQAVLCGLTVKRLHRRN